MDGHTLAHEVRMTDNPSVVLLLGPDLTAVSGVSTHLNQLLGSALAKRFRLQHFQVGSEGREEQTFGRLTRLLLSPFALAAKLLAERVDLVHINTSLNRRSYLRDVAYLVVARLCGVRVVYQVHGGDFPRRFAGHKLVPTALLRATLYLPDVIVVLTQRELKDYRDFLPGQYIKLLPNAIDSALYANLERRPRDGQPQPLRLLSIGRLTRIKGLSEALHGLHQALSQGIAAQLIIAGSGPEEANLRQLAQQLELTQSVTFAGAVAGAEKMKLFEQSDVLLLPSHVDKLPYALLEGMAAGMPAITTRVGGIPDVATEDLHGLFVMPGDPQGIAQAIARLAGDPDMKARMSKACRKRIAMRYSVNGFAGEFANLYLEICTARRSKTRIKARP
jgi:glycosyltransferase involved in cell wall biosynthesis